MTGTPEILLVIPIEGRVMAILVCDTYEDEVRLAFDLAGRDLVREVAEALAALADVLGREAV